MKIISFLKWFLPMVFLIAIGAKLIAVSNEQELKSRRGYEIYAAASAALRAGDTQTAYILYIQSSYELADPAHKATALYEAANVGWVGEIADYNTLVGLYKQSLRYNPGFYEAAFNLEYLYWLRVNASEDLPEPEPGPRPSREEVTPSGDV